MTLEKTIGARPTNNLASELWQHGYKIINADRTSLWASYSWNAIGLTYPVRELVARPEYGGPIATFREFKDADLYLRLVRDVAWRHDQRWKAAIIIPLVYIVSADREYWGHRGPGSSTTVPGRGSDFADLVFCLE